MNNDSDWSDKENGEFEEIEEQLNEVVLSDNEIDIDVLENEIQNQLQNEVQIDVDIEGDEASKLMYRI